MEGDDHREAYTAIEWGRQLSRERYYAAEAEAVDMAEGNMCGPAMQGPSLSRGRRPYHAQKEHAGTWEISRSAGWVIATSARNGKVMSRSR